MRNLNINKRQRWWMGVVAGIGITALLAGCGDDDPMDRVAVTGVSLDQTSLALVVGETETLMRTVTPSNATDPSVTWSSSDTSVATVNASGLVTSVTAGAAMITVTTNDGGFTATCSVTVTDQAIAVTGVQLDRETLDLLVGGASTTLMATISPVNATNTDVIWTSSNTGVATVSATGEVSPVAEGTATITVTTEDGGHTDTCSVNVIDGVLVDGVTLDTDALSLTFGGVTGTLVATVSPADATIMGVTWSSSDTTVATVSATGEVTATGSGTAEITVTTVDGSFTDAATVTVSPDAVTGMVATAPLTGQAVVAWTVALDPHATGVEVTMTSTTPGAIILPTQTIPVDTTTSSQAVALSGLSFPESYMVTLVVLGGADTRSNSADVPVSTVSVTRIVRSTYVDAGQQFILMETNGSGNAETHDVVIARVDEPIPTNYRWVLYPGLADSTDASLVSFELERYNATTMLWETTSQYLRVNAAHTHVNVGQWYGWASPDPDSYIAMAQPDDETTTFADEATFAMVSGGVADSVVFEWYPDRTRRLIHTYFHVMAQPASAIGERFDTDSSWFVEPVTYRTP